MNEPNAVLGENHDPLVSVLMTSYNREKYIAQAISSVLASTYVNFELIVVDDCSTDSTVEIARSYAEKDDRVRVYINENNLGDYPNRNQAASYAKGKYIKYLDSDDIIYPHGLDVMVRNMEQYPRAGFGLSELGFIDKPHPALLIPEEAYRINFLSHDLFGRAPGSSIINREAFESVGGFTGKRQVGDHEFWLIMARKFSLVTMQRDFLWDRVHSNQEQGFDSEISKSAMHFEVQFSQLEHADCPLNEGDKVKSLSELRAQQRKSFWRYVLRKFSFFDAFRYRRAVGLKWNKVFFSAVLWRGYS